MAYRKTLFGSDASVPHHFSTPSQAFIPSTAIPHLSRVGTQFVELCFEIIFAPAQAHPQTFEGHHSFDFSDCFER
jgi:hypothetical protein